MVKLKIRQKLLFILLLVALVPLVVVTLYWSRASQTSLTQDAEAEQKILTSSAVYRVNQYITDKVNALIIHSQSPSVQSFNVFSARQNMQGLIKQDKDIQTLTLANSNGQVILAMNRKGPLTKTTNISNTDAFRAATFLSGRQYISPVSFNSKNQPILTIAVPLVQFSSGQNLLKLSTAGPSQIRTAQQINGVLIETANLSSLWHSVLSQGNNSGGYTYVVDSQGNLIAYPSRSFQKIHLNLRQTPAVQAFLKNPTSPPKPSILISERGVKVLSSYGEVSITGWGVITEQPTTKIFALANHLILLGSSIFIVVIILVIVIAYFISKSFTKPILSLTKGATLISQGKLETRIINNSGDEIGMLSRAFNDMANNLGLLIQETKAETNKEEVILSNVTEGIVALDVSNCVLLANKSASNLIGKQPHDMIGQQLQDLYKLTENDKTFKPDFTIQQHYREITLTNSFHRISYIDILVNPIEDDPTGIKCIVTIIDNTKERELDNMKVDFVSMAAHELRTPLTAIRGYLDLIAHDNQLALSESLKNYFEHMEANSLQLVSLINNLLNVSRIERNALSYNPEKLSWTEVLKKVIADQQFMAKSKKISLVYDGPEDDVYILAEQITIQEVINNLISNAINYTDIGGHVTVKLDTIDNQVITKVIDDGIGIPDTSLPFLFTKFYRVRSGLSSGSGGTGLGLFISRSIVEMHGGTISVESEEGKGSTFTISLPIFNQERYNEIIKNQPYNIRRKYGWITKDTTR